MDAADLALIRASNKANNAFAILYIYYMLTWASFSPQMNVPLSPETRIPVKQRSVP